VPVDAREPGAGALEPLPENPPALPPPAVAPVPTHTPAVDVQPVRPEMRTAAVVPPPAAGPLIAEKLPPDEEGDDVFAVRLGDAKSRPALQAAGPARRPSTDDDVNVVVIDDRGTSSQQSQPAIGQDPTQDHEGPEGAHTPQDAMTWRPPPETAPEPSRPADVMDGSQNVDPAPAAPPAPGGSQTADEGSPAPAADR
jgi:hypothetical protein